jgi:YD repeat-containing protein
MTYDYDALDRVTKVTYPDGTYEETVYNRLDPERSRDRLGRRTHTFHDALRRQVAIRDPLGRTTTFQWASPSGGSCGGGGCGGADKLIDANGNVTTWERDVQGRPTRESRADGSDRLFVYENTTSRLKEQHDSTSPTRQIKGFQYFLDDKLKKVTYTNEVKPTPDVEWSYDPVYGRVATMVDVTGTTSYGYHPAGVLGAGLVSGVDGPLPNDTITYGYDELGRVTTRQIDGSANTIATAYDALGRVNTEANALGTFTYTYEGATNRGSNLTYPNGQATSYSYFGNTGDHRLQRIHHRLSGGATLSKFDYTHDAVGNIRTWSQQADANPPRVLSLGYDLGDQLATASRAPAGAVPNHCLYL